MKKQLFLCCCAILYSLASFAQRSDVILQGFYWNTHPGDFSNNNGGGIWWDSLRILSPQISAAGFQTVWVPPPNKGAGGMGDMGYGLYDYYDLGQYNQKGTVRTRFGNRTQLEQMIANMHINDLRVMCDIVLNHRGGADAQLAHECSPSLQADTWTVFTPNSNRFNGLPSHFHPNNHHCDINADYHNPLFFQDICYFNGLNSQHPDGWYKGPHNLGAAADSLVTWGRWLVNDIGFDELRIDAVKHIEPGFLGPFLAELHPTDQPFAVGEFYDYNMTAVKSYRDQVAFFPGSGQNGDLSLFDFNLRGALKEMCNNGSGGFNMDNLNYSGLVFHSNPLSGSNVVTFLENHDTDRVGLQGTSCPGQLQFGNSCLEYYTDSGHDPVFQDKYLGYAYLMAAEGRPTVFWKDYRWYGLGDEITQLMALRATTAGGGSTPSGSLSPYFPNGWTNQDVFALVRWGYNDQPGCILILNDATGGKGEIWVNTPFIDTELKDYSDAYLFVSSAAYSDSRALLWAEGRNYAWYAPTGLYPLPPGELPSSFTLEASTGAKQHYIALFADSAANYLVNGSPIEVGDEIAAIGPSDDSTLVAGIGRIGQSLRWDGVHDMMIEILGGATAASARGGLVEGAPIQLVVKDASTGEIHRINTTHYLPTNTSFTFNPKRAAHKGGSFSMDALDTDLYRIGGISAVGSFESDLEFLDCQRDIYEPNDIAVNARWLPELGVVANAEVCPRGDVDWFKFKVKQKPFIRVQLANPSADFLIELYDASLALLSSSNVAGAQTEVIDWNQGLLGNTYYIKVEGNPDIADDEGYRLKVLERDLPWGAIREEATKYLTESSSLELSIFPSPTQDELYIQFPSTGENYALSIVNIQGEQCLTHTGIGSNTQTEVRLSTRSLPQGMYFLQLQMGSQQKLAKFLKE